MRKLYGMVCALITPMTNNRAVDEESLGSFCKYLVDAGVHSLYPNGTNGESLSLTVEERKQTAMRMVESNDGKSVLYIQCGAGTVADSYQLVRHAAGLPVDGVGLMTPVFFPMDDISMHKYYADILKELPELTFYAYNIPSRTGNDLSVATLGRLMDEYANLKGIKYSSPDLLRIKDYASCGKGTADVLIGCDSLALSCLMEGGRGYVSGPGAVFPKAFASIYDAYAAGNFDAARAAQARVVRISKQFAGIPEIPAIKYMLWKKDVIATPVCRMPLRELDRAERGRLDDLLVRERDE